MKELMDWASDILKGCDDNRSWEKLPEPLKSSLAPVREKIACLQSESEFFIYALKSLPNPIFIKDENVKFKLFNDAYSKFYDINAEEFIGKSVMDLPFIPEKSREIYHAEDTDAIKNGTIHHYHINMQDGRHTFYWSKGFRLPNDRRGLVGEIVDVSQEKELEKELNALKEQNRAIKNDAAIDPLTGLYNRRFLAENVDEAVNKAKSENKNVCLLIADIDLFKHVNDDYGHTVGDEILVKFADIIKKSCRSDDACIRYGGDEFLIILFGTDYETAQKVANRIVEKTRSIKFPDGKNATTSIGVVKTEKDESIAQSLVRADEALYEAKEKGRNTAVAK